MRPADFPTYQDAVDYEHTETSIFSASTMRIYLRSTGLYLYLKDLFEGKMDSEVLDEGGNPTGVYEHHEAKEDVAMLFESLKAPNADGQDFNFIQFKADGVTPNTFGQGNIDALDNMINNTLTEKAAELTALKNICIARSNKTSQPFAELTQEEYDYDVALKAITWVDVENTVIIHAINKAAEIEVSVTDGTEDVSFEVIVDTSKDGVTYSTLLGTSWKFSNGANANVTYQIANNRALKSYNKFRIKPSKPCSFTASAKVA